MMHDSFSQTTLKDDSKYRPRTYKGFWQFMACHQHTQQGYKNLLRDFNDRGSYGPTTTQQQAHKELLQDLIFQFTAWTDTTATQHVLKDFQTISISGSNRLNSDAARPAGFANFSIYGLNRHNSNVPNVLQDLQQRWRRSNQI